MWSSEYGEGDCDGHEGGQGGNDRTTCSVHFPVVTVARRSNQAGQDQDYINKWYHRGEGEPYGYADVLKT